MSSNTLRGIGQEGDGEGESRDASGPATSGRAGENAGGPRGGQAADGEAKAGSAGYGGDLADSSAEAHMVRTLDALVPGTRSLDVSVPGAQPSLDAKIPALAATLMGVTAASLGVASQLPGVVALSSSAGGRDKGTVQGRDIHLPAEAQRVAGVRAVTGIVVGDSGATPELIERSEPTLADPVKTAAVAQATIDHAASHQADLNSHTPWYEQEPVGAHVYEEEKPSFLGRAAIGVAVAAGVSVVLFAIVRLYAQNSATDEQETPRSPLSYKSAALPPPVPPAPSAQPVPDSTTGNAPPSAVDEAHTTANPTTTSNVPRAEASASPGNHATAPPRARPPARGGILPQATGPTSHAPPAPRSGSSTQWPSPGATPALPATVPPPILPTLQTANAASAMPKSLSEAPTPSAPIRAASPRAKPIYDPDSTLPLNVE